MAAMAIIRCCSSFSHTSGVRTLPHENSRSSRICHIDDIVYRIKLLSTKKPNEPESKGLFLQTPSPTLQSFDKLSAFEGFGRLKLPVMAVLFTNSLLIGTPLQALSADICEPPESSVFNMPLLLLVALVGGTVGGSLSFFQYICFYERTVQWGFVATIIQGYLLGRGKGSYREPERTDDRSTQPLGDKPKSSLTPQETRVDLQAEDGQDLSEESRARESFFGVQDCSGACPESRRPHRREESCQRLRRFAATSRKYRDAIQYHNMVLAISNREGEDLEALKAYGAIADCYTELGDLEKAGSYYDTYIARLETD
ncbi:hypothetical protein Rs2_24864 [Raphanus sativus]|nr:hypothetical protein Rs2_24864 [Raphanus sativus]